MFIDFRQGSCWSATCQWFHRQEPSFLRANLYNSDGGRSCVGSCQACARWLKTSIMMGYCLLVGVVKHTKTTVKIPSDGDGHQQFFHGQIPKIISDHSHQQFFHGQIPASSVIIIDQWRAQVLDPVGMWIWAFWLWCRGAPGPRWCLASPGLESPLVKTPGMMLSMIPVVG